MADEATWREQLGAAHERRQELESRIRFAGQRQRFLREESLVRQAREDEVRLVAELDRAMTRIRSLEAKLSLGPKLPVA